MGLTARPLFDCQNLNRLTIFKRRVQRQQHPIHFSPSATVT